MSRMLLREFFREIRHTKSRFFSILILVALAVAFLSGLKATAPDMKRTGDDYLDSLNLADVQILSNLGLTQEDLDTLLHQPGVKDGEAVYTIDAYASTVSAEIVAKVHSLTEKDINQVQLRSGRMPEKTDECVVEEALLQMLDIELGNSITLTPAESTKDALSHRSVTVVGTIRSPVYLSVERGTSTLGTGGVHAYIYLPCEAFSLDAYTAIYLCVDGAAEMTAFYEDYDDYIDSLLDSMEPLAAERAHLRYTTLVNDATAEIDDAQRELDEARTEAEQELGDAEQELADARKELDDGWLELYDAQQTLKQEVADAEQEIADGEQELADALTDLEQGEIDYADGLVELEDGRKELEEGKLEYEDGLKKYQDGLAEYESGLSSYRSGKRKLDQAKQQLESNQALLEQSAGQILPLFSAAGLPTPGISEFLADLAAGDATLTATTDALLDGARSSLDSGLSTIDGYIAGTQTAISAARTALAEEQAKSEPDAAVIASLQASIAGYEGTLTTLSRQRESYAAQRAQLTGIYAATFAQGQRQIDAGWDEYNKGRSALRGAKNQLDSAEAELNDAAAKLEEARLEIEDAERELADGEQELKDARVDLDDGWVQYYDGLQEVANAKVELQEEVEKANREIADARRDLRDGEEEYADGYQEYLDAKQEAETEIADAQAEITDARREVAEMEQGEWYLFGRSYNPGYTGFGQDADRMGNLASVFPLIFFLVAALVCLTTMTRMVEEQRIQVGSLKALGYGRLAISFKYLGYGLLPSLVGSILGLLIGYTLFPSMIFTAYQIMYQMPSIQLHAYPTISVSALLAAVACTTVSSLYACLATLRESPAGLMRPRTPKAGKRVFLEYIPWLWRRMKFTYKVTARNLFRYKKRFFMTVIGIGGCTALIIAGFGLRYSLTYTMSRQYEQLFHYTAQMSVSDTALAEDRQAIQEFLEGDPRVQSMLPCRISPVTAITDRYSTTAYLEVVSAEKISQFVDLYEYESGDQIHIQDEGVYIDQKLSELLGVKQGDSFVIDGDERAELKVAGIFENYTGHFIYMTPAYYRSVFAYAPNNNAYFLTLTDNSQALCDSVFEDLLTYDGVAAATRISDTRDTYLSSMERIDFVVVIVILAAAALAMVVLFNLSNINITERMRELATIKLLGFYDREVTAYVYRENVVLTAFGIIAGIFMGHYLHTWLIRSVEIDLMMFGRETDPRSYLFAAVLTALFSMLVNVMAHYKMKTIDMVESLKSAE